MAAWLPYLVAIAATLAAALWRLILAQWLGSDLPYLTFFGAVMASASRAGPEAPGWRLRHELLPPNLQPWASAPDQRRH